MSTLDAWHYILERWLCSTWQALPETVKQSLHLAPNMGMYSGMLVTRAGSEGVTEFVYRMNHRKQEIKP